MEQIRTKFDRETRSQILKHARSAKQTSQGYKFFSKTANITYKKLQTIFLMLYKRQIKKQ